MPLSAQPHINSSSLPILVVDKPGILGCPLVMSLKEKYLTVLVSSKEPEMAGQVIHVPFTRRIPVIPDNRFSHILLFYHGEKTLEEALPAFLAKARESNGIFVLLTDTTHYQPGMAEKLFRMYDQSLVIVYGEVFPLVDSPSPVNTLLSDAKHYGRIELPNDGLENLYPVHLQDAVEGIMAVVFTHGQTRTEYALYPKHPATYLSLAHALQKQQPLLALDFKKHKKKQTQLHLPSSPVYVFGSAYPLEDRVKQLSLPALIHTPLSRKPQKKPKQSLSYSRKMIFLGLSLLFFLLSLPMVTSMSFAFGGGLLLLRSQNAIEQGDLAHAEQSARAASSLFRLAEQSVRTLKSATGIVGLEEEIIGFSQMIQTGRKVADAATQGLSAGQELTAVASGTVTDPDTSFAQALNSLKESLLTLQQLQAEGRLPASYQEKLREFERPLTYILNTIDTYPHLLGFTKEQTYMVLFQNNFELRPTGGFIGSYGMLRLSDGKIVSFTIHDVYDADGKLTARIAPPFPLRRYLGASNLFMRDSNFAIDYPTSAGTVANFLQLTTGEKVDGVIAIDTSFLISLLSVTGPLYLPDYKETLTTENAYLITQTHVEKDFFPGSTQKKDFLRAVHKAFEQKLKEQKISYRKLLLLLTGAVEQKHLLFAFNDTSIQRLFSVNNLSGSLLDTREGNELTTIDTLAINEANVGLNKVNYYVKRSIDAAVAIDGEGKLTKETTVTYQNTSNASPFGGEYKTYVRLLVPKGETLTGVRIDNVDQAIVPAVTDERRFAARNFRAPRGLEVEEDTSGAYHVYGVYLTVAERAMKKITFVTTRNKEIPVDRPTFTYDLRVLKQPGTLADSFTLTLSYPVAVRVLNATEPVSDVGGKLVYSTTLEQDRSLRVTFTQR